MIAEFAPDFVVGYGGSRIALQAFAIARQRGIATVFLLYNFSYENLLPFENVDAVVVPSACSAGYYHRTLGLRCHVVPCVVDPARFVADEVTRRREYVLFVNPSFEKGVYVFARIADELGRSRPDIPFLVIEGRGTEATLVGCGLELLVHKNVFLMNHPPDPRDFWRVAKVCLMPSLWWESQGLVAVEAMFNGVPVLASDRGALPETLGESGFILPIPARLTTNTRELPTAEEVRNWTDLIIKLWDDDLFFSAASEASVTESLKWSEDRSLSLFTRILADLRGD